MRQGEGKGRMMSAGDGSVTSPLLATGGSPCDKDMLGSMSMEICTHAKTVDTRAIL
jgi:hypothetical protein